MNASGSYIEYAIEKMGVSFEEQPGASKYDVNVLLDQFIFPKLGEVASEAAMTSDNIVIVQSFAVSIVANVTHYELPPFHEIIRVVEKDGQGNILNDFAPGGEFDLCGWGWRIEHNTLVTEKVPQGAGPTIYIVYVPTYEGEWHYGDASGATSKGVIDATKTIVTLASAPTYGRLDRRANAYVGQLLRVLRSGGPYEERIISAYNTTTREATLRTALTGADGDTAYEVVPPSSVQMWNAVVHAANMEYATVRMLPAAKREGFRMEYMVSMKALTDRLSNLVTRKRKSWGGPSVDSPDVRELYFFALYGDRV